MKNNRMTTTKIVTPKRRPQVLRFSPTAWAKLLYLRDAGETEIGAFGISAHDDLLFVEEIELVAQACTWAQVDFDDEGVAEFFDRQVDAGRRPEEFGRIWIHTHPGSSPDPSSTDETTFARVFGRSEWALMFILARGGQTFARLRCNVGPGADIQLPVEVDYSRPFAGTSVERWEAEYLANVRVPPPDPPKVTTAGKHPALLSREDEFLDSWARDAWDDYVDVEHAQQEAEYGFIRDF
jgi:proteasome lid subunit RPN8/RPN11